MESDESGAKPTGVVQGTAGQAVAAIVKEVPVYRDAIQPAARRPGHALAAPLALLNTAIRPVKSILLATNLVFDRLDEALRRRLKGVPAEEKIVEPPPSVAGPLLSSRTRSSSPSHRCGRCSSASLPGAMNADTRGGAHPSFVEIIKQLSVAEARLLTAIAESAPRTHFELLRIEAVDPKSGGHASLGIIVADVGSLAVTELPPVLGNLARLGILSVTFDEWLVADAGYEKLEARTDVEYSRKRLADAGRAPKLARGVAAITAFGEGFVELCVADPKDPAKTPTAAPP